MWSSAAVKEFGFLSARGLSSYLNHYHQLNSESVSKLRTFINRNQIFSHTTMQCYSKKFSPKVNRDNTTFPKPLPSHQKKEHHVGNVILWNLLISETITDHCTAITFCETARLIKTLVTSRFSSTTLPGWKGDWTLQSGRLVEDVV